jgi:hypothetical protein
MGGAFFFLNLKFEYFLIFIILVWYGFLIIYM